MLARRTLNSLLSRHILPAMSLALSLPTLVALVAGIALAAAHSLWGFSADLGSAQPALNRALSTSPLPALLLLYVFLGPIFGCVVATASWSYADEAAQAGQAISNRASKRALLVSGATLCVLVLATAVALGFKRMFS